MVSSLECGLSGHCISRSTKLIASSDGLSRQSPPCTTMHSSPSTVASGSVQKKRWKSMKVSRSYLARTSAPKPPPFLAGRSLMSRFSWLPRLM